MRPADVTHGICFCVLYVMFEWWFYHHMGTWHYPFLNYEKPYASLMYAGTFGVFVASWAVGCQLCRAVEQRVGAKVE
eukprot:5072771-Prymnesium_polylepis.1